MKYKHAKTQTELQTIDDDYMNQTIKNRAYLQIEELSLDDLSCEECKIGLAGSPTKVKKIDNVVLQGKDSKVIADKDTDIKHLMNDLIKNHTLG